MQASWPRSAVTAVTVIALLLMMIAALADSIVPSKRVQNADVRRHDDSLYCFVDGMDVVPGYILTIKDPKPRTV